MADGFTLGSLIEDGYQHLEVWCHSGQCFHHARLAVADLIVAGISLSRPVLSLRFRCTLCGSTDTAARMDMREYYARCFPSERPLANWTGRYQTAEPQPEPIPSDIAEALNRGHYP